MTRDRFLVGAAVPSRKCLPLWTAAATLFLFACLAVSSALFAAEKPDVEKLIHQLDDADYQIRERATKQLIKLWEDDAVLKRVEEAHKESSESKKAEVEDRTKRVLELIKHRRQLGKNFVETFGAEQADALLQEGNLSVLRHFQEWMGDADSRSKYGLENETTRVILVKWLLGRMKTREEKQQIVTAVEKGEFGGCAEVLVLLLKDHSCFQLGVVKSLGRLKPQQLAPQIAELLTDHDYVVRAGAAVVLELLRAKEYSPKIAKLLEDDNSGVRRRAMQALAYLDAKEYTKEIAELLKDKDADVRGWAVFNLGVLKAKEYAKDVAELLDDKTEVNMELEEQKVWGFREIRQVAVGVLGDFGAKDCAPQIATLLREKNVGVRYDAVVALGKLEAREFAPDLAARLNDREKWVAHDVEKDVWSEPSVREAATQILKKWGYDVEKLKKEAAEKK